MGIGTWSIVLISSVLSCCLGMGPDKTVRTVSSRVYRSGSVNRCEGHAYGLPEVPHRDWGIRLRHHSNKMIKERMPE